jgi:hypothetical protein
MSGRRFVRGAWGSFAFALFTSLAGGRARAGDDEIVNLIPSFPINTVKSSGGQFSDLLASRTLPSGREFKVRLRVEEPGQVNAAFEIWPQNDAPTCDKPDTQSAQYHRLGMQDATDPGGQSYAEATVPPLQIDTAYCYRVTGSTALAPELMRAIAVKAADHIVDWIDASTKKVGPERAPVDLCRDMTEVGHFVAGLEAALKENEFFADPKPAARLAYASWIGGPADAPKSGKTIDNIDYCIAYLEAASKTQTKEVIKEQIEAARGKLDKPENQDIADVSPPQVVFTGVNGIQLISATSDLCLNDANIDQCINQLDRRRGPAIVGSTDPNTRWLAQWVDTLKKLKALKAEQRAAELEKVRPALSAKDPDKPSFELYLGNHAFVRYKSFVTSARSNVRGPIVPYAEVVKQLDAFEKRTNQAGAYLPQRLLFAQLDALINLERRMEVEQQVLVADRDAKRRIFRNALRESFYDGEEVAAGPRATPHGTRALLRVDFGSRPGQTQLGRVETPNTANYASIDLGVLVAAPFRGGVDPWVVPYLGANIYFGSVDRNIPFDAMAGNAYQRFRQRISLTIGATFTVPTVPGRRTESVFLSTYPLVALGFRATHFTRVGIGCLFYRLGDANPASSDTSLRVAPFLSFSMDIDLVSGIKGQSKFTALF